MKNKNNSSNKNKKTAYIFSHSHWDREWRYSLWETRFWLLDWLDEAIPLMESGKFAALLTDGQVAPVLDYLEIRPEMTDRVKKLVANGQLEIGPWLYLPDEFPVDGEAMVRNLVWGHRKGGELGGVCKIGYTPFGWGQTAQLSQIYAGFGIDNAFLAKRVRPERAPQSEFLWEAPDGTQILCSRYSQQGGRSAFYTTLHLLGLVGMHYSGDDWAYDWKKGGIAYHRADRDLMEQDHFQLDQPRTWHPELITQEEIDDAWNRTGESVLPDDRLLGDGFDYAFTEPLLPEIIAKINEVDKKGRVWKHTNFADYLRAFRTIDRSKLTVVKGELRDGPATHVTGNALATRARIKQRNKLAQNRLIRMAEPASAYMALLGAEYPQRILNKAWEQLLQSHPHDSINGVTQDVTADDVMGRLHQSIEISDAVYERSLREMVKRIDLSHLSDEEAALVVFNPLPYERSEVVEAYVTVPAIKPRFKTWTRRPDDIIILDADGNPLPTQWQSSSYFDYTVAEGHIRGYPYNTLRHHLYFETGKIPAGGYRIFRVGKKDDRKPGVPYADLRATTGTMLRAPNVAENEFVRVEMNPNGTFNMTDKELGRTLSNLNYFEDSGQPGSYWTNEKAGYDKIFNSLGCAARIWAEESGPLQTTLHSEIVLPLPATTDDETSRRSDLMKDVLIHTSVTVKRGRKQVDVNVTFDNCVESHRLRVMFPTGLKGCQFSDAGGHFNVDRRSINTQGPTDDMTWQDMAQHPQNNFVDLSDGKAGFAVLNDSMTEFEVLLDDERTLALTLVRGVKNWICTEGRTGSTYPSQKGGQQLGIISYRYAICTHKGNWEAANIPLEAELFNIPVAIAETRKHEGMLKGNEKSFFEIDNPMLRFSAFKKCEDRDTWVVRFYNPAPTTQKGRLVFNGKVKQAWLTNLNEERESEIPVKGNTVAVSATTCRIVTVEVDLEKQTT